LAFRFKLASVLRVRESIERNEELTLQRIELEVARAQRRLDELNAELERRVDERNRALRQPTPAYRLRELQDGMSAVVDVKKSAEEMLQKLREQRDAQMKRYQTAHNGRRMLTEMRSQQKDVYEQEQERAQQKMLDDIFAARRQRA
jgi:flagellar FliJ protein